MRMHPYRRPAIISKQLTSALVNNDQHLNMIHDLARLDDMSVSIDLSQNEHYYAESIMEDIYLEHNEDNEYLNSVISNGGIDIMLRFLMYNKTLPASNRLSQDENGTLSSSRKYCAVKVLHTLLKANTIESRLQGKKLANDWEFLSCLLDLCSLEFFTSLSHVGTVLLSHLTNDHDCILDLAKFENVLSNFTTEQLANFCRILFPIYKVKFSTQIRDSNQAIFLKIPNFYECLVNIACNLSHHLQLNVLGGLATCLKGKHQRQVCQVLVEAGFISKFSKMFMAHLKNPDRFAHHEMENCGKGLMGQLIIAFALDCLDRFCEGVPSKYMLLSRAEQREVQYINVKLDEQYKDSDCNSLNMFHNDKQLLRYICSRVEKGRNVFRHPIYAFNYVFKMLEVLASFLRGGSHCLQMYMSRRGFLDRMITIISSEDHPESLVAAYAVIAELVIFNPILYKELAQSLIRKHTFETFFKKLKKEYVFPNSTRLMEALILTSDMSCDTQCKLTERINSYKIEHLKTLLQFINMNDNTMPMIETVMVILTTANKRKQLPQYLQALASKCSTDYSGCRLFISFQDAFFKWQKDIELDKIMARTNINIHDWHETVEALFEDEGQNDTSLQYWYLDDQRKVHSPAEEMNEQNVPQSVCNYSGRCALFQETLTTLLVANKMKKSWSRILEID